LLKRYIAAFLITIVIFAVARRLSYNRPVLVSADFAGAKLSHITVKEQVGPGEPLLILETELPDGAEPQIIYRERGDSPVSRVRMLESSRGVWEAPLPELRKGRVLEYAFEVPLEGQDHPRLPSESERFLKLKYKGDISKTVLVLHIFFMFAAFYFMVLAIMSAIRILLKKEGKYGTIRLMRWVILLTFIGGWPLGFILNQQRFGVAWEGFPFGYDITDNKTQLVLFSWLVTASLVRGSVLGRGDRSDLIGPVGLAWAVVTSTAVTLLLYLVPHSL